jgi:hypothetical protein
VTARVKDANGWFEIKANPLSKAGVYPYLGSSIKAPNPMQMYQVFRPPEELSKPATLDSLKLLPFVNDHTMLGPEATGYTPVEQKGMHGVVGETVFFKDCVIYGNVKVFSDILAKLINAGKVDLSCGYRCKYVWTPGTYNGQHYDCIQTNIIFNHLALVDDGRMGSDVAVMDGSDCVLVATFDAKDMKPVTKVNDKRVAAWLTRWTHVPGKSKVDGKPVTVATMDAAEADADAEPDASDPTLADVIALLKQVGPQFAEAMAALKGMASGTDPNADPAAGADKKMDANGNPVAVPPPGATAAPPPGATAAPVVTPDNTDPTMDKKMPAMDKGMPTMDAKEVDKRVQSAVAAALAGLDEKTLITRFKAKSELAAKLSGFIGTFDHADMTLDEVGAYAVEKLKIPGVAKGAEVSAITAYLHGRKPVHEQTGMDKSEVASASVDNYLSGKK